MVAGARWLACLTSGDRIVRFMCEGPQSGAKGFSSEHPSARISRAERAVADFSTEWPVLSVTLAFVEGRDLDDALFGEALGVLEKLMDLVILVRSLLDPGEGPPRVIDCNCRQRLLDVTRCQVEQRRTVTECSNSQSSIAAAMSRKIHRSRPGHRQLFFRLCNRGYRNQDPVTQSRCGSKHGVRQRCWRSCHGRSVRPEESWWRSILSEWNLVVPPST